MRINDKPTHTLIRRLLMLALFCILAGMCHAAKAESPDHVASYSSQSGESLDDFVTRIAPDAVSRSLEPSISGEVCGEFYRTDEGYSIDLYTLGNLERCAYKRRGNKDYIALTFHTHVSIGDANRPRRYLERFSQEDYDHPGYMATERAILFQQGRGTDRRISSR